MQETRVNLKHLLEDIRDSYGIPLEEIIIVELVANSLDSGASFISFFIDPAKRALTVIDNGKGMRRKELKEYHNIASTTKVKGKGIGFAGIGAKLSLLLSNQVITETRGPHSSRSATTWQLISDQKAVWKFLPFSNKIPYPRGTAITIEFKEDNPFLLSEEFISQTVQRYYYPLFLSDFFKIIYRYIYKKGVNFFINNQKLEISQSPLDLKHFKVVLGKIKKNIVGFGYLGKISPSTNNLGGSKSPNNNLALGLGISTFGKVIKSGWEWIGLFPQEPYLIQGAVEVPSLAEILTTNKMDFLRDATSLKKYYRYRRAIQEAIFPIFENLGQEIKFQEKEKILSPLRKEIERALGYVLNDFPELTPLLGIRRRTTGPDLPFETNFSVEILEKPKKEQKEILRKVEKPEKKTEKSKKEPALIIAFEEGEPDNLARMLKNTIYINQNHPAYLKAQQKNLEEYHILFSVGWVLSKFLGEGKLSQDFINRFLASWGKSSQPSFLKKQF